MQLRYLLLVLVLIFVWGFNFVVIEVGVHGVPPLFLAAARFFFACFPAVFFLKRPKAPFSRVVLYSFVIFVLQFACFFVGVKQGVPAGLASILMQIHIFFSVVLAFFMFQERIKLWQIVGGVIAFAGIGYAGMHAEGSISLSGFCLVIAAAAFWGTGSAISKTLGKVNMLSLVVWGSLIAWPPLLLLSLILEGPTLILSTLTHLSWTSVGATVYLSYLSTVFAYGAWSWLIHYLPLSTVAPFTLLVPVVSMICSALVLGEPMQGWKIGASILVIGGICVNLLGSHLFRKSKKALEEDDKRCT